VEGDGIVITTAAAVEGKTLERSYEVGDLLHANRQYREYFRTVVQATAGPWAWEPIGKGTIHFGRDFATLEVSNKPSVHEDLESLLAKLRQANQ
jgi:hypothetical protein